MSNPTPGVPGVYLYPRNLPILAFRKMNKLRGINGAQGFESHRRLQTRSVIQLAASSRCAWCAMPRIVLCTVRPRDGNVIFLVPRSAHDDAPANLQSRDPTV
jgi:hypothetical protein